MVGAITISRLFHGQPSGRTSIAEKLAIELPTGKDARKKTVKQLGLVWVSRVAVDAPYRHSEIGTQLLRTLRTSIGATLPWEPGRVEVLQSVAKENAKTAAGFFTAAGYRWDERSTYTAPARMLNDEGVPEIELTPLRTLYYWADFDPPP